MGINCSKRLPIYFFIRTLSSISFKYNEYNSFSPSAEPWAGVLYPFRFSDNPFHFVMALLQNCRPRWLPTNCVEVPGCMEPSHGYLPISHEIDRGNARKHEKITVRARFYGWSEGFQKSHGIDVLLVFYFYISITQKQPLPPSGHFC